MSDDLEAQLQRLPSMSRKELIALWKKHVHSEPPCPDNPAMLRSLLASGLQAQIAGNKDAGAPATMPTDGAHEPAATLATPNESAKETRVAGRPSASSKQSVTSAAAKKELPATQATGTKQALLIRLLRRKSGITIEEAAKVTGWQPHSIRGAISGMLKKKFGLAVVSDKAGKHGRVYRILG